MTKYLISILGVVVLLSLHGCTTVSEPQPQPAPQPRAQAVSKPPKAVSQPALIERPADTGVEWVTDTSDLKSRHRFQLAQHIVEVGSATRYYGGSVADIDVGARARVVGVYRDEVVVADTVYIEQLARPKKLAKATTDSEKASAKTDQSRVASGTPQPTEPTKGSPKSAGTGKTEQTATQSVVAKQTTRSRPEKVESGQPSSAEAPSTAREKEQTKAAERPKKTLPSAEVSTRSAGVSTPPAASAKASESQLAKAESSVPPTAPEKEADEPAELSAPPPTKDFSHLVFDERILPMPLDRGWRLDRQRDIVDGTARCVLLSPAVTIFDGYYPAKMWLRINPVRAWVKTDSNIDISYPGQGLRVDGGTLAPFAKELLDEQTAYTDASVLHGMAGGHTLTVALGFWPTWPKTKTQTARFDLAGFANAYAALQACSQQQQAARN